MGKFEKINQQIKKCKRCTLWKTRNNIVPGEGPENAKIMIKQGLAEKVEVT